jgi:hypothetical protein
MNERKEDSEEGKEIETRKREEMGCELERENQGGRIENEQKEADKDHIDVGKTKDKEHEEDNKKRRVTMRIR